LVGQEPLHDLAPLRVVNRWRAIVDYGVFLSSQLNASEPRHQWLLILAALDDSLQDFEFSMPGRDCRLILSFCFVNPDPIFIGQRHQQRLFHDPVKLVKTVNIERLQIILRDSPIFCLILGDDTEIRVIQPFSALDRFAVFHILRAFLADHFHGNFQSRLAIDAASSAALFIVGLLVDDFIAKIGAPPNCLDKNSAKIRWIAAAPFFKP
jgi:hypothetical protein